ncbi:MAG: EutN/CcmL family microcompartment protein [Candidatus Atribacteria bacterium]|nr:EutN/CcmL family microcompartment protein [Candidatus Atribacteria bacterium]
MIFGKVMGTVVSTQKNDGVQGKRYLIVQSCQPNGDLLNEFHVAIDLVGSGYGEMVLLSQGSSARQTQDTYQKAVDCIIVGIVDLVEKENHLIYQK